LALASHTVEIESENPSNWCKKVFEAVDFPIEVPVGTKLRVLIWPGLPDGERMHPRFALTERGGPHLDYGVDEGSSDADTTLISLLAQKSFLEVWRKYHEMDRTFGEPAIIDTEGSG
jgi:hypothetical protein